MGKLFHLFVFIFLLACGAKAQAQQNVIDSLLSLSEKKEGLEKAELLVTLSDASVYTVTKDALRYAQEAYVLAEKLNIDSVKYLALRAMGYANGYLGHFEASLENMTDGFRYYESTKDSVNIAKSLSDIAYLLKYTSNDQKEIMAHSLHALSIREKIKDTKGIAYSLNNIGVFLWDWDRKEEAMVYFLKALPYFEQHHLVDESAQTNYNVANYYYDSGDILSAKAHFAKALALFRQINHRIGEASVLTKLAQVALSEKDKVQALEYLESAKKLHELSGNIEGLVSYYYNTSSILLEEKMLVEAETHLLLAKENALTIGLSTKLPSIYQLQAEIERQKGNHAVAYGWLKKGIALQDSLFSVEKHQQIEELRAKYETDKKEVENQHLWLVNKNHLLVLKRNRYIIIIGLGFVLLLIAFLLLYFKHKQSEEKMKSVLAEQRLLRTQMNPHFIFNAISAIQNDILRKPPRESVKHLSNFASLIRQFLDSSKHDLVDLKAECHFLKNYMEIQQLRYSYKFDYEIEVDEELDVDNTQVPPLLSQVIIENAIEHGLKQLKEKGWVKLKYERQNTLIIITVEDNGIGINSSVKKDISDHKSFALEATQMRLKMVHKKEKTNYLFEIIDKSELEKGDRGTIVRYSIPLIEEF